VTALAAYCAKARRLLQALLLLLGARLLLLRSTRRRLLCTALRLLLHCTGSYFRRRIGALEIGAATMLCFNRFQVFHQLREGFVSLTEVMQCFMLIQSITEQRIAIDSVS
jgi:hypothetical protein